MCLPKIKTKISRFPHSIEAHLRSLGMPTQLKYGKIELLSDYVVCTEGQQLTVDQAQILKLFDKKYSTFKMVPSCAWSKNDGGRFKVL